MLGFLWKFIRLSSNVFTVCAVGNSLRVSYLLSAWAYLRQDFNY